jgi:hypothetical protein
MIHGFWYQDDGEITAVGSYQLELSPLCCGPHYFRHTPGDLGHGGISSEHHHCACQVQAKSQSERTIVQFVYVNRLIAGEDLVQ